MRKQIAILWLTIALTCIILVWWPPPTAVQAQGKPYVRANYADSTALLKQEFQKLDARLDTLEAITEVVFEARPPKVRPKSRPQYWYSRIWKSGHLVRIIRVYQYGRLQQTIESR